MARKYDFISELYNRTCKTVVANPASWEAFLRSACYNYRLRFDEQLLVHAQRPDATAVLQIDDWNQKFGRWVNRGAHGIAVFEDADQRRQRLVHYFDISDTHPSRFSRRVPIWQMRDEYTAEVIDTLESTFGELNDKETLAVAIESAARNAVEDNIPDYLPDLIYSVKDSFLDGVSEEEITHIFKKAVRNSVAYMTMTRLGIEAGEYFEPDDLRDVVNFTTPATLNALGYATSDIAEMGLAEISRTILALDRQNRIIAEKTKADYNVGKEKTERSPDDERDHLHDAGGLSAPRSDNAGAAGAVDGQVRPDAEEVPERASQGTLLQPADELRPERASERHGAQSERDGTDADGADGSVGGRDGESESDGYDELGSEDEQYPEPGSGDRDGGGNLRLDYYDRSHEDKSLPFFGGDDTVREILSTTPHLKASKGEIRAFFEATADENARISYIKRIFNNDYTEVILSDGRRVGYKTYQNVLQLWEGSYLSRTAQSFYDWGVIAQHFEAMRLLGELQDTMKPLPSIDGQLSLMTAGAEERKPSAFAFSQEIIDAVLTRGSGISEGKMRIYEQFQKSLSAKENADFLKNEYGWGGVYPAITGAGIDEQHDGKGIRISKGIGSDKPHIDLKWSQVEKRIAELIKLDRYLNPKEKAQYPEWLQRQEERRAALAEERRNREIMSTAPSEKTEPKNERYEYHLGSTVYLGANEYEILSFDDERVMLYDPNCAVSMQLIPTSYEMGEAAEIDRITQALDTLSKGVMDQGIGNVSFALAEKHADVYRYYSENKTSALFAFNVLIYGDNIAISNVASRVFGQLSSGVNTSANLRLIDLDKSEVGKDNNFYPLPWAVNEILVGKERNLNIWNSGQFSNALYRLPYVITAEEASEFFRLPIGSDRITAGLKINESGKGNKTYSSNIINAGDITVGKLRSSTKGDTIGFSLKDLAKHMLVVGTPGSGKTTFSVSLLDRLWKDHNIPFLVIEPAKNEYRAYSLSNPIGQANEKVIRSSYSLKGS